MIDPIAWLVGRGQVLGIRECERVPLLQLQEAQKPKPQEP